MQRLINLNKTSLFCIWHVIVSLKCCQSCENCDKCKINWPLVPPCVSVPGSCGHRTLLWIIKSGGTCWHMMPGHHHLSPGAACQGGWWCQDATRVMWTQTHSLIFLAVFWCHVSVSRNQGRVMHPIGPGNTRSKERKWGANRKYPDYRNKWENILCADLSCVVCDPLRWWQPLSWMSWGCVIEK